MNIVVILAGGLGVRFGQKKPKQYHLLNGTEVIEYVYNAAVSSRLADKTIIVSSESLRYEADYAPGGATHNESVKNAITYVEQQYPSCEKIVFADSVRPFVSSRMIDTYFELLDDYDAVITAQHITDSLGKKNISFVDRSDYFLIQKPEAFRFPVLQAHFHADSPKTAIVQQMPPEARICNCFEYRQNMKITYPEDLRVAEIFLSGEA